MERALEGRVAIVCGASQGIGLAIAAAFAQAGASVVMFARRADVLGREAERLGAHAVAGDVREEADLRRLVDETLERHGSIDVLVNNGGGPPRGPARGLTAEQVREAVELLLVSAIRLTELCLPHLERSGRGRVVNVESSSVREPIEELALSNLVRPGVVGWAKTLAREVGPLGITVNTILPGRIDTARLREAWPSEEAIARIPLGRVGRPEELAAVAVFLASDAASYVTGAAIPVDGGLTRGLI